MLQCSFTSIYLTLLLPLSCDTLPLPPPQVEYLPVLFPSQAERANPRLFAARCRMVMARALNLPLSRCSLTDNQLAVEAVRLRLPSGAALVGCGPLEDEHRLDWAEAKGYLRKFAAMGVSSRWGRGGREGRRDGGRDV